MARSTHQAVHDPRNDDVEIYINGAFFPRAEAKVSVFDSGFLVGDGVWEGIRLHHGRFAFLDRHLDRLFAGAAMIGLDLGMTREEVSAALHDTVRRNGMEKDYSWERQVGQYVRQYERLLGRTGDGGG